MLLFPSEVFGAPAHRLGRIAILDLPRLLHGLRIASLVWRKSLHSEKRLHVWSGISWIWGVAGQGPAVFCAGVKVGEKYRGGAVPRSQETWMSGSVQTSAVRVQERKV